MPWKLFTNTMCNGYLFFCHWIIFQFVEPFAITGLEYPFQVFDIMSNISLSILVPQSSCRSQKISCGWALPCRLERAVSVEGAVWMLCISMPAHWLWHLHSESDLSVLPFLFCKTGINNNTYFRKLLSGFKFRAVSGTLVSECLIPVGSFPSHYLAMPITPSPEKEKQMGSAELLQRGAGWRTKGGHRTPAVFRLSALWECYFI